MQGAVIFYFSGTGNTAWLCRKLANLLSGKNIDTKTYNIEEVAIEDIKTLIKGKLYVGFAYPVYGSDLPQPMKEFLIRFPSLRQKTVFCFCTQEAFSGDGARVIKKVMWHSHGKIKFAEHFNMPNNISIEKYGFKSSNDMNDIQPVLDNTLIKIERFAENIATNIRFRRGFNIVSHLLGLVQRIPFRVAYKTIQKSFSIDNSKCFKCGKCKQYCPMNNIDIEQNEYTIGKNCCLCLRCYNYCDYNAVLYRKTRTNKTPYKGIQNFEDEIKNINRKCYHNGKLPQPKDKRFGVINNKTGNFTKGFKIFLVYIAIFVSLFILIDTAPIEIAFVSSKFLFFIFFGSLSTYIFLSVLLEKKKSKSQGFWNGVYGIIVAFLIYFSGEGVVAAIIDVCSKSNYTNSQVLNIEKTYGKYSQTYIEINYKGAIEKFSLWGENQGDLEIGEKYTFRIMKTSNTAIVYYDNMKIN